MATLPADLAEAIDQCMIRDRYRLRKSLLGKRNRKKAEADLQKSVGRAEARKSRLPSPQFPENLPVSGKVEDIQKALMKHQVVVVAGETGSGKTTQLPKICLDMGRGVFGVIGHTQPRRVAARTVANRIAEELGVEFGREVGYQVRFTDKTSPETLVKVMTDGILLAETQQDQFLEQYDTIIIDEAHERSLNIDFLLGYLKRILPKRPDLKVIITSATIDVERFSKHFNGAPVVEVSGRTFPVDVHYRPIDTDKNSDSDERMYQGILDCLREISQMERKQQTPGDTLVFLSGEREIRDVAHLIRKSDLRHLEVLPLYSRLSVAEQNKIFQKHTGWRVVLATNVAETSLTVPGIRYVIDPGFARISRYSVRSKVQQLPIEAISRASADQRKGRCGRVSHGICFRLYSEDDYDARPEFTAPEILRTNLASVILQMLNLKLGDINRFPFVERPDQRQINDGYHLLRELLAVDERKNITRLGRDMARLPIDLRLARMVMEASRKGCLKEVLTIVSALAAQDPRERPHEAQQAADEKHRQHWHEQSDFMAFVNLWTFFETHRQDLTNSQFRKFCRQNFLSYLRLVEWRENHRQLALMCKEMKLKQNHEPADYASIHQALLAGLLGNIGEKVEDNEYLGARNRRHYIFPGSSQFKRKPRWIVSSELVETTRLFGRTVAEIQSDWVEPLAGHLVKRTYHEPHFDAKRGQVFAYEEVMLYGIVIVKRRKVAFGNIDPAKSRHLFIQEGLVEQQLDSRAGFYRHNCQLIEDIEKLESKSRKRDLLVDSYAVYRFYDALLPDDIVSDFDLDSWRKVVEVKEPKKLYLTKEALMKQAPELSQEQYPDQLQVAGASLKLDYHFDPQHEEDGVSLNLPVALLRQVPRAQLDFVIPGLLEEKCLALIKSLPKSLRKNFIPAPDYAARVSKDLEYDGRDIATTLAEKLFKLSGVKVTAEDFSDQQLDQHLKMNLKVLDEKGGVLGRGRDIDDLIERFAEDVDDSFLKHGASELEQTGLTSWSFDDLPEVVDISRSGIVLKGYPALVDEGQSVAIKVFDNQSSASIEHRRGVLRLVILSLQQQYKYFLKNIPGFQQFALYYATRGSSEELKADIVDGVFRYTFIDGKPDVRTATAFNQRLENRGDLGDCMNQVAKLVGEILKRSMAIDDGVKALKGRAVADSLADIQKQLANLVKPGFLSGVPFHWLRHYPRYLKAVEQRIEKLNEGALKDNLLMARVLPYQEKLSGLDKVDLDSVVQFRWMIEEFRVSLFAQPLGTSLPVSEKRLDKQWQKVVSDGPANGKF